MPGRSNYFPSLIIQASLSPSSCSASAAAVCTPLPYLLRGHGLVSAFHFLSYVISPLLCRSGTFLMTPIERSGSAELFSYNCGFCWRNFGCLFSIYKSPLWRTQADMGPPPYPNKLLSLRPSVLYYTSTRRMDALRTRRLNTLQAYRHTVATLFVYRSDQ